MFFVCVCKYYYILITLMNYSRWFVALLMFNLHHARIRVWYLVPLWSISCLFIVLSLMIWFFVHMIMPYSEVQNLVTCLVHVIDLSTSYSTQIHLWLDRFLTLPGRMIAMMKPHRLGGKLYVAGGYGPEVRCARWAQVVNL